MLISTQEIGFGKLTVWQKWENYTLKIWDPMLEKTGPVNYKIQGTPDGRTSTLHVDKLYGYTPADDEELVSWLPVPLAAVDASSQYTEHPLSHASSQTDTSWPPAEAVTQAVPTCIPALPAPSRDPPPPAESTSGPAVPEPPPVVVELRRSKRVSMPTSRVRRVTSGTDKRIAACLAETLLRFTSREVGGNLAP